MSTTAVLIKRLRERGLSQTEISRRTGIPQPRISKWAAGHVPDAADDSLKLKALDDELPPAVVEPGLAELPQPTEPAAAAGV